MQKKWSCCAVACCESATKVCLRPTTQLPTSIVKNRILQASFFRFWKHFGSFDNLKFPNRYKSSLFYRIIIYVRCSKIGLVCFSSQFMCKGANLRHIKPTKSHEEVLIFTDVFSEILIFEMIRWSRENFQVLKYMRYTTRSMHCYSIFNLNCCSTTSTSLCNCFRCAQFFTLYNATVLSVFLNITVYCTISREASVWKIIIFKFSVYFGVLCPLGICSLLAFSHSTLKSLVLYFCRQYKYKFIGHVLVVLVTVHLFNNTTKWWVSELPLRLNIGIASPQHIHYA